MNERIVIISGALPLPPHVVSTVAESAIVLAVDGGLDHALAAGMVPSGLIGDLDSVSAEGLAWAQEHATISQYPTDKDRTDTEFALSFAAEMMPSGITLIGGGDRLDHTIGAIGALGAPDLTGVPELDAWWDGQHIDVVHGPGSTRLHLEPGSTLSLVALHGRCEKVSITGVRWELDAVLLEPATGLGISNEVLAAEAGSSASDVEVRLSRGVLTVFNHPVPRTSTPALPDTASRARKSTR